MKKQCKIYLDFLSSLHPTRHNVVKQNKDVISLGLLRTIRD